MRPVRHPPSDLPELVEASNIKEAIAVFEEKMKGTLADYVIVSVSETAIMDVFQYVDEEKEKEVKDE